MADCIGEISFYSNRVHWKIPYFLDIPQEIGTVYQSPDFQFKDENWSIRFYPNGEIRGDHDSRGWFGMKSCRTMTYYDWENDVTPIQWVIRFGIVGELEEDVVNYPASNESWGRESIYRRTRLIPRSAIVSKKDRIIPGGDLHLFMSIEETGDSSVKIKAKDRFEQLSKDFKEILLNGNISDVVLKVKGREFKAHRCVLAARSPVFLAMITHEKKDKISGVVDIQGIHPNIFSEFLNYLYTGSVENLTSENAVELYTTADKYQVNGLKEICMDHMVMNASINNFCDVLALSIRHGEEELKDICIEFFSKNPLDIIMTPKWQTFLRENPILGNKLFIKHLQLNK